MTSTRMPLSNAQAGPASAPRSIIEGVRQAWHYSETGSGRPLILLHGIGMSHAAWNAVTPRLRSTRRTIAFDIAGFGVTPPLPRGTVPTLRNLVDELERSIHEIGIDVPVDIAGNSLGGAMALEAAHRGIARTVVAISPIGLWERYPAHHVSYVFSSLRFMAVRFPGLLKAIMRRPFLRELALAVPVSVGSRRMPVGDAFRAVDDLAASTAFEDTFDNTRAPFFRTGITVPVTVAFGHRDWILLKGSRRRDRLPAHVRWIEQEGWGHAPMWSILSESRNSSWKAPTAELRLDSIVELDATLVLTHLSGLPTSPLNDDGVPRIASENYVSSNGVEAGDDEDLRADREEQLLAGGRCGDESPRDE